ncbi:MAG: AAA family ATPase [Bacteriovoracales bacterium]|nr:AAA family ATPase [Bacteriovoracales bacterium]
MKIINIFSGPGIGKSTTASGLFYFMKKNNLNCEYVSEYAKDLVWEKRFDVLESDPVSVLSEQHRRVDRLKDKVEYVVTDSPILLAAIYANRYLAGKNHLGENGLFHFNRLVHELFNKFDNYNYFLMHGKKINYREEGRLQKEQESLEIDEIIFNYLVENEIQFNILQGNEEENLNEVWRKIQSSE